MLLTYFSICYSRLLNNELGDPIPQNIQNLISNLQDGHLPNDLDKFHLGGKKITIQRTEIKIEDISDDKKHSSSSSSVGHSTKNKYTNKKGIVLNINKDKTPVMSTSNVKTEPMKFKSLNSNSSNSAQLLDTPKIVKNSEKVPTHPVFPMENLVSFIKALEENLEQLPLEEQDKNRDFNIETDKGKVHLQRISLNKKDLNAFKQAAQSNAISQSNPQIKSSGNTKPHNLFSNIQLKNFVSSSLNDISNKENFLESRLAEGTDIETAKSKADKAVTTTKTEPINNQTASEELTKGVIDMKTSEGHEADKVVAEQSGNVANEINGIVNKENTNTSTKTTTTKTNNIEQKKSVEQPQVNVQQAKQILLNDNKNPKAIAMTPNSLSDVETKKLTTEKKGTPLITADKRSNIMENLNSYNLKTSDMAQPKALFSAGKSSEFLSQLKSIFNKMSTGSALSGGYLENNMLETESQSMDYDIDDDEMDDDDD